jgi:hypothetical protein
MFKHKYQQVRLNALSSKPSLQVVNISTKVGDLTNGSLIHDTEHPFLKVAAKP